MLRAVAILIVIVFAAGVAEAATAAPVATGAPPAQPASGAEISGTIRNALDSEPLGQVAVTVSGTALSTVTAADGTFHLGGLADGTYVLEAAAVGYYAVRQPFTIAGGRSPTFDIVLASTTLALTDTASVTADAFGGTTGAAAGFTLEGHDIANLGGVLADDPLRAARSLPGVTANNDFSSEFSVRGAAFDRVGLYFDGILLHSPFHTTDGVAANGSLSLFSGDLTDEMTVFQGAWPVRYGDRTAGVIDVSTRSGTREDLRARVSAGASALDGVVEGPIGRAHRGAWIVAARKSYLQYILNRIDFGDQPPFIFGFADTQARVDYDLTSAHTVSVSLLDGTSTVDRRRFAGELSSATVMTSAFRTTIVNVGSRYVTPHVLLSSHAAVARERGEVGNRDRVELSRSRYGEAVVRSDATVPLNAHHTVEAGVQLRRLSTRGTQTNVLYAPSLTSVADRADAAAWQPGVYGQETYTAGRLRLAGGLRHDRHSLSGDSITSPYASLRITPRDGTRLQADWGRYGQFAELQQFGSRFATTRLRPQRADHLELLFEQRLDARTRFMVDAYQRSDRDLLARSALEPRRREDGNGSSTVIDAVPDAAWGNTQRGHARGLQVTLQRRSANGFTGWLSYAYGRTTIHDALVATDYPSDYDQRHTVNLFVSRRLSPTINVSGQLAVGSGMPLPGFYERSGDRYLLSSRRNQLRAPVYQRTDVRLNKALKSRRFDATLFVEVINVTNHTNEDFDAPGGYDRLTGQTQPTFFTMFPILPSAGLVINFGGR